MYLGTLPPGERRGMDVFAGLSMIRLAHQRLFHSSPLFGSA